MKKKYKDKKKSTSSKEPKDSEIGRELSDIPSSQKNNENRSSPNKPQDNKKNNKQQCTNNVKKTDTLNNAANGNVININNEHKNNSLNHSVNDRKEFREKNKIINYQIDCVEFFSIIIKVKNSYSSKKGKINITNYFIYDIKNKNFKKVDVSNNVIINMKNKPINHNPIEVSDNKEKIMSDNEKNKASSKNYISDKYYNKKEGLHNFGTTCFLNSFIQILIHVPGLIEQLKDASNNIPEESLLYSLLNIADNPSRENLYQLRLKFFRMNSSFKYYKQEDSQEFGDELLKALNNELSNLNNYIGLWKIEDEFNLKNNKDENTKKKLEKLKELMKAEDCDFQYKTLINYFFYYYETVVIICDKKVVNFNYYGDVDNQLSFDTNSDNNELDIYNMLKKKYVLGNNKLIKLPLVFNITLLRAIIEEPLIKTKVFINHEINLKEFLDKDFGHYSLPTEYTIYALNVCKGPSKRYGHYYSYILINDEWYQFDDWRVQQVKKKTIEEDLPYIYGIYYINKEYLKSLY